MKKRLMAVLSIFLCLLMLMSNIAIGGEGFLPKASAAELVSGSCGDNVTYSFNSNNGILTISGNGPMEDYNYSLSPFYDNSSIKAIIIENGITSVGRYAFPRCDEIMSVTIPESVETIGEGAFCQCLGFTEFNIPTSVESIGKEAFSGCANLKKIFIPRMVLNIGEGAFSDCAGLNEIRVDENNEAYDSRSNCNAIIRISTNTLVAGCSSTVIPDTVDIIGASAFRGHKELKSVLIPESVAKIGESAFYGCTGLTEISVPANVKSIGNGAFSYCTGLIGVSLPTDITSISEKVFSYCECLTDVSIPESVKSIGASAFLGCASLNSIDFPSGLISIGEYSFYQCVGLTEITIPANVSSIGKCVFSECSALISIKVDAGNQIFDSRFNCNAIVRTATNQLLAGCATTIISDSVTSISEYAFYQCLGLTSIDIPNTIKVIGNNAFYGIPNVNYSGTATGGNWGAENLNRYAEGMLVYENSSKTKIIACCKNISGEIEIPNSVTSVGKNAFSNRTGLTEIILSDNLKSIGDNAFYGCTGLRRIVIPDNVESIGDNAFCECSNLSSVSLSINLETIGEKAFCKCTGVTSITIPNCVESIGNAAFEDVLNVVYSGTASGRRWGAKNFNGYVSGYLVYSDESRKVIVGCGKFAAGYLFIPATVKNIAVGAFNGCYGINSIYVDSSNTEYDSRNNCNAIIHSSTNTLIFGCSSTVIHEGVSCIAAYAFNACRGLKSIVLPESVTEIDEKAFYNNYELESVVFEGEVKKIGEYAFYNCSGLTDFEIPKTVISIGKYAFSGCTGITKAVVPDGINTINEGTFNGCRELTEITIPDSVTSIDNNAFCGCFSLKDVYYLGTYAQSKFINIKNIRGENYSVINAEWHYDIPESISISSMPDKTVYLENETVDITGLKITARYSDGYTETIEDYFTYSPKVTGYAGTQNIMVSYMGKSTSFEVTAEHIFIHYEYNYDAKVGEDGTETAKCENCDETHTRIVPQTAKPAPLFSIKNRSGYDGKTIDYRSSLRVSADVQNCSSIEWHVSGAEVEKVSDYSAVIKEAKGDFTFYFTAKDLDGKTVTSETETVYVKHGFFDKLSAFFKGIFNKLPQYVQ